jgi:hypothetical protein
MCDELMSLAADNEEITTQVVMHVALASLQSGEEESENASGNEAT